MLPDVAGWERGKPTGERMTMPVPFSQTETTLHERATREVQVKIVDSAFSQLLVAPWAMFLPSGYEKQTSDGYEKSSPWAAIPVSRSGTARTRMASSTWLWPSGSWSRSKAMALPARSVLHDFASKLDTGKLAGLK